MFDCKGGLRARMFASVLDVFIQLWQIWLLYVIILLLLKQPVHVLDEIAYMLSWLNAIASWNETIAPSP